MKNSNVSKWRTLVRVEYIKDGKAGLSFPAIEPLETFEISESEIPFKPEVGERYFVRANLSAKNASELLLSNWENP